MGFAVHKSISLWSIDSGGSHSLIIDPLSSEQMKIANLSISESDFELIWAYSYLPLISVYPSLKNLISPDLDFENTFTYQFLASTLSSPYFSLTMTLSEVEKYLKNSCFPSLMTSTIIFSCSSSLLIGRVVLFSLVLKMNVSVRYGLMNAKSSEFDVVNGCLENRISGSIK